MLFGLACIKEGPFDHFVDKKSIRATTKTFVHNHEKLQLDVRDNGKLWRVLRNGDTSSRHAAFTQEYLRKKWPVEIKTLGRPGQQQSTKLTLSISLSARAI